MKTFESNDKVYTLRDGVESLAILICEDLANGKRTEEILQECKVLDSLSNALMAINTYA